MRVKYLLLMAMLIVGAAKADPLVKLKVGEIEHKVNRSDYQKIESSLEKAAVALSKCNVSHIVYKDPIIGRQNSYVVRDGGAFCNIVMIKDSLWQYNCKLTMVEAGELSKSLYARIENRELLGDFNDVEQSLFFNQNKCAVEEL